MLRAAVPASLIPAFSPTRGSAWACTRIGAAAMQRAAARARNVVDTGGLPDGDGEVTAKRCGGPAIGVRGPPGNGFSHDRDAAGAQTSAARDHTGRPTRKAVPMRP